MTTLKNYLSHSVEGKTIIVQAADEVEAIEFIDQYVTQNNLDIDPQIFTDINGEEAFGYTVRLIGTSSDGYPGLYVIGENDSDLGSLRGMKYATNDEIMATAVQNAQAYGVTSTLAVKNHLRREGYFITQKRVSSVMQEEADYWDLEASFNGTYLEYKYEGPRANDDDASDSSSPAPTNTSAMMSTPDDGTKVSGKALLPTIDPLQTKEDSWEVNTAGRDDYTYYESRYTSDEVRNSFAKENQNKMQNVRARRCKRSKVMTF